MVLLEDYSPHPRVKNHFRYPSWDMELSYHRMEEDFGSHHITSTPLLKLRPASKFDHVAHVRQQCGGGSCALGL